jgi:hypothetical protein
VGGYIGLVETVVRIGRVLTSSLGAMLVVAFLEDERGMF